MRVLVLPVSGGGFTSQLAIMEHLCETHFVPDLTLASSGGNLAAYICSAAKWKWASIKRIASELSQDIYARPWNRNSWVTMVIGYFKGNAYNKGSGAYHFFMKYFDSETIGKYEIWTGTYNKERQKARLFCNRKESESCININLINKDLMQSMDPVFADNQIKLLSEVSMASASIPSLVPCEIIEGEPYSDGGLSNASPLVILKDSIYQKVRNENLPLHLIYVNSVDLSIPDIKPCKNIIDSLKQIPHILVKSHVVNDRSAGYDLINLLGYDLINHQGYKIIFEEYKCDYDTLIIIQNIQKNVMYSLLEIYPMENNDINIVFFKGEDIVKSIEKCYEKCMCRFWRVDK